MMKRFIRRVTAFALSAMLLTAPMAQAQELMTPEGTWLSVEIVVTLGDGSQFSLDVTPVTTTLGSTVYWLDDSMLTDEERAALPNAQLRLVTDTGEIYSRNVPFRNGLENTLDYPISVANRSIRLPDDAPACRLCRTDDRGGSRRRAEPVRL